MDDFNDEFSLKKLTRIPRLVLLGSASLAAILCAGFVANAMLTRSQLPNQPPPATAQMYVLPEENAADTATATILPADPMPEAEVSMGSVAPKPEKVAAIPPKPLAKPAEAKAIAAKPACEADECVSWETTVNKALAASSSGSSPARMGNVAARDTAQPGGIVRSNNMGQPSYLAQPDDRSDLMPPADIPMDRPLLMQHEPSTVGGMAKSAASTVVTQSGKLVDNLMRWSDTAVSKLVTPPRWASADDQPANP